MDSHVPPPRVLVWAVSALFLAATVGGLVSVFTRGPWMDEFLTLYLIDTDLPFVQLATERWLSDTNPPLYFLALRLMAELVGMDYVPLRLFSLIPLIAFAVFVIGSFQRVRAAQYFLLAFTILWCASLYFGDYFSELRAYFIQHAFGSIFLLCLVLMHGWDGDARKSGVWFWSWLVVSLTITVNLNVVSTLFCGAAIAGYAAYNLALPGQWKRALWLCISGLLSIVPLVVFILLTLDYLAGQSAHFWIDTSTSNAIKQYGETFLYGSGYSLVAFAATFVVAWGALGRWIAAARIGRDELAAQLEKDRPIVVGVVMLVSLAFGSLALLVVNAKMPIVLIRYLTVLSDGFNCALALGLFSLVRARALWLAAAVINGVIGSAIWLYNAGSQVRWNASTDIIVEELATCPDMPVYSADYTATHTDMGKYRLAALHNFKIEHTAFTGPPLQISPNACGAILWVEHITRNWTLADTAQGLIDNVNVVVPPGLEIESYERTDTGAVVKFSAP